MFNIMTSCLERLYLFKGNPESHHKAGTFELGLEGFRVSKQSFVRGLRGYKISKSRKARGLFMELFDLGIHFG